MDYYTIVGTLAVTGICFCFYLFITKKREQFPSNNGLKTVPVVPGNLPIVGHGLTFSANIIEFVRTCYRKYGKIFRIKVYNKELVVVCDRELITEFFKKRESDMSLYKVLDNLFFGQAFTDDYRDLPMIITMVKQTVGVNFSTMVPKIMEQAGQLIERLRAQSGKQVCLTKEAIYFVSHTSAKCFIGIDMTDEFYDLLNKFTQFLNKIVVLTYFFPQWTLKWTMGIYLRHLRRKMTKLLEPEIQSYRDDPDKNESNVIRKAIEYIRPENNKKLTNEEIGDILICLLYVSSENTALGLSASLIDLARHPDYWNEVRETSERYLHDKDYHGLLKDQLINACVMESARLTSHVFALMRYPVNNNETLGEYAIGNCDIVALCEPMLMRHECASDVFENANEYNPERFLEGKEKKDPQSVMTWGAIVHLCPGKMFAIYEIKIALSLIVTNFERFDISDEDYSKLDYFSPSAFAERNANVFFNPLFETTPIVKKICFVDTEGNRGYLFREFINETEQERLYSELLTLSENSGEQCELSKPNDYKFYPLCYYNLVYTKTSNTAFGLRPLVTLRIAERAWETTNLPEQRFNSVYSQLYSAGSSMKTHKDQHVDWGVSINLGASASFLFGTHKFTLHSGDVFIADFSKTEHGVLEVHNEVPSWFKKHETFGKVRCSVQVRSIDAMEPPIMTLSEYKKMITM